MKGDRLGWQRQGAQPVCSMALSESWGKKTGESWLPQSAPRLLIHHCPQREHLLPLRNCWLQHPSMWQASISECFPALWAHPARGSSGQLQDWEKGLAPAQNSPLPRPPRELFPEEKLVVRYGRFPERCFSFWICNHNFPLRSLLEIPKKGS